MFLISEVDNLFIDDCSILKMDMPNPSLLYALASYHVRIWLGSCLHIS